MTFLSSGVSRTFCEVEDVSETLTDDAVLGFKSSSFFCKVITKLTLAFHKIEDRVLAMLKSYEVKISL